MNLLNTALDYFIYTSIVYLLIIKFNYKIDKKYWKLFVMTIPFILANEIMQTHIVLQLATHIGIILVFSFLTINKDSKVKAFLWSLFYTALSTLLFVGTETTYLNNACGLDCVVTMTATEQFVVGIPYRAIAIALFITLNIILRRLKKW